MTSLRLQLAVTFGARMASAAGGSLLAIIIAQQGGPAMLGEFTLFMSLLGTAGILARGGLDVILIRTVAEARAHDSIASSTHLLIAAVRRAFWPSLVLAIFGALFLASGILGSSLSGSPIVFVFALPMLTVLALFSGYMKGAGRPWVSPLFEIGGISAVASVILLVLALTRWRIDGAGLLFILLVAMAMICILSWPIFRSERVGSRASDSTTPVANGCWRGQWDFMLIALSAFLLQAGSFIVAAPFLSDTQLGLLRAAERLAVIVSFPMVAINPFIAGRIVHHLVKADTDALRGSMRRAMLTGGGIAALPLVVFILAPALCLNLLGTQFVAAAIYLRFMALANFVVVLFGPSAMAMNMGRMERRAMIINTSFLVLGVLLFPLLTMSWGASGFTAAYAAVAIGRTGVLFWSARTLMGEENQ